MINLLSHGSLVQYWQIFFSLFIVAKYEKLVKYLSYGFWHRAIASKNDNSVGLRQYSPPVYLLGKALYEKAKY